MSTVARQDFRAVCFLGVLESIGDAIHAVLGPDAVWSVYVDGVPEGRSVHVRMSDEDYHGRCVFTDIELTEHRDPTGLILWRVQETARKVKRRETS